MWWHSVTMPRTCDMSTYVFIQLYPTLPHAGTRFARALKRQHFYSRFTAALKSPLYLHHIETKSRHGLLFIIANTIIIITS